MKVLKHCKSIYYKLLSKSLKKKLWGSIDEMPLYNWFRIHQTNNLTYLRKSPGAKFEYNLPLLKHWTMLQDEYLETFGVGEEFEKLIRLKKDYIVKLCDYIINDDKFKLTEAEFISLDIREMMDEKEPISDADTLILIEQSLGFRINPKETTVLEYYNYINFLSKKDGRKKDKQ